MNDFASWGLPIVGALLVGLIVGRFAVIWALNRFKAERLWERKLNGYVEAITAMSEMKIVSEQRMVASMEMRDLTEEYRAKLTSRHTEARQGLDKTVAMSQLLLSKEAANVLMDVPKQISDVSRKQAFEGILAEEISILTTAIQKLIQIAQVDLLLNR